MLTLVYGIDWTANRDYILNLVTEDVRQKKANRILLVPELISHDTERRLCGIVGDTCSRYAEVLSFSRITKRICDWSGCGMQDCMDNGGRLVAMAAAARQLHSKLKLYASVETKPEFLVELIDMVDEFKRCCITASDLMEASQKTSGAFAQKLEELSLLLGAYDAICQQGKHDPREQLTWGLEQLKDSDFAQNHVFYIDGFPDFTVQNMAIIFHLIRYADQVVVSINCDHVGSGDLCFQKAGETAAKLLGYAKRNGIATDLKRISSGNGKLLPVCGQLFQGKIKRDVNLSHILRAVQANSVYESCVFAAEYIMDLIKKGCRYRDISVVCPDLPAYENALKTHFQICGIPCYIAGKDDILEKSVISTVLAAVDAVIDGFETKNVLRYLKSALSPIELEQCDLVENYVLLWNIQGKAWLENWHLHPTGLQENWTQDDKDYLSNLNDIRKRAIEPLIRLFSSFKESTHLSQQTKAVYDFLMDIHLQERLSILAEKVNLAGDNRNAQILNQLWEILLSALEQMEAVLGQTYWSNESFSQLFRLILSQYDVGTIPPVLDTVMVGPVTAMRCQQVKHLVVLGSNEGKFPTYATNSGLLTECERDALRKMGVSLTGGAAEGLSVEFSDIYGVFCGAQESAYVSCISGKSSFVFRRISEMAGGDYTANPVLGAAAVNPLDAGAYLKRLNDAETAKELGISTQYNWIKEKSEHTLGSVSKEGIRGIYGRKLNLSASQIDKHADCRLAYFLKYGLRAKEFKPVSVDPAEFGTYVHSVLEETAREICHKGGFKVTSLEETMEIAKKYSDAYIKGHFSQIDSERISYLFQRNSKELMMVVEELWAEFQMSAFTPFAFELSFGDQGQMPPVDLTGREMEAQLRGYVDRVDTWQNNGQNYFRVVDYKTGKKDFDYCDVFNGLGLQMLLYLFALEQEGERLLGKNPIPAGVQYFPARAPVLTADGELSDEDAALERQTLWKRKGLILGEDDVLCAMEDTDIPVRLSYRRKKDGTISGDVANREEFKMLKKYIFSLLGTMVDEIASGNITPNPYTRGNNHNACRYCPFGAVCHTATVEERRNYKMMSSQRFWDEVAKEMENHG